MAQYNHQLKRLQPTTNTLDSRKSSPTNELIRESIQNFSTMKFSRSFKPGPHRARRGGGGGRRFVGDRHWYSSVSLPKRTINYDLAESFMDHSTNPLSSDLYKIRFKHSAKQWPTGRFRNYREKLEKLDGSIVDIICTRTYPIVQKRKKPEKNIADTASSIVLMDPITQEQKKKLADKQTNLYANLFGYAKIPQSASIAQTKKPDCITSNSIHRENKADQQC